MALSISLGLVLTFLMGIVFLIQRRLKLRSFPPGPSWRYPILGHLPMLGNEPYKTMLEWKKTFGPLIGVQLGSYLTIFMNDLETVKEVFNRNEFAGRAHLELFVQSNKGKGKLANNKRLACKGVEDYYVHPCFKAPARRGVAFNDGPINTEQRKFVTKNLRLFSHSNNILENKIREEIEEVLEIFKSQQGKPIKMKDFFHVSILNSTWSLFMGQRFERGNEKLKHLAESIHEFCTIDGFLVQLAMFLPFISKYFPEFSGYQRQLDGFLTNYKFMEDAYNEPIPPGRIPGQPRNFKEAWMDQVEKVGDDKTSSFHPSQNCYPITAGDVFMSSMESVSTSIEWALLYMACYPEVQRKLQAEIDEQIGTTRSPLLTDRPRMTYMDAATSELLRFSSITPMSGPWRRATEDVDYKGYKIPQNTFIVANTYALHHDPEVWGDPENFRPERFLTGDGKIDKNVASKVLAFSTGKRNCLGENLARDQLFLYIVSILQKFTVSCTDKNPSLVGSPGMVRYPKPFEIIFTTRFSD